MIKMTGGNESGPLLFDMLRELISSMISFEVISNFGYTPQLDVLKSKGALSGFRTLEK